MAEVDDFLMGPFFEGIPFEDFLCDQSDYPAVTIWRDSPQIPPGYASMIIRRDEYNIDVVVRELTELIVKDLLSNLLECEVYLTYFALAGST